MTRALPALLLVLSLLVGCDSEDRIVPGTAVKAEVGRIPAYPQRAGDPAKGYDALLNRAAVTCGLPYSAYLKLRGSGTGNRDPSSKAVKVATPGCPTT